QSPRKRRSAGGGPGGLPPGRGGGEPGGSRKRPADERESDGQAGGGETAGQRDRGHAGEPRGRGVGAPAEETPPRLALAGDRRRVARDGRRRLRRGGSEKEIELLERVPDLLADQRAGTRPPMHGGDGHH